MRIEILSPKQIRQEHETSLQILAEIGVKVNHEEVFGLLIGAGARGEESTGVVKFPVDLISKSIKTSPRKHILYGRDFREKARFGYDDHLFMSSAGQYLLIDGREQRRPATLKDTRDAIKLGDALPEIDIVGPLVLPSEIPVKVRDIHVYAELVKTTTKPCVTWINNGTTADYIIKIFSVLAGGSEELRRRPMVEAFIEPISPLQFSKEGLEILLKFARAGLPVGFGPMAMAMATAPATLAGAIAQENAEILAGIVISQIIAPGLPITYWGIPHVMDAATGNISFGSPEQGLMASIMTQLGRWYGFPVGVNVGLTDSKIADAQNGIERAATLLMGAFSGADIFGHMGIVGADQGASLAELVLNNEMAAYLRRITKGITIDSETLAFEVIKRVGIGGHFLEDDHTLRNFKKEVWIPAIMDRLNWETWEKKGRESIWERALRRKNQILRDHSVSLLDEKRTKEIDEIVQEADKKILGKG